MASTPLWAWAATVGLVIALLTLDFIVAARRPHRVGMREATLWSVFYIVVALVFGLVLWATVGSTPASEYYVGWLLEKSLSVDNLFVFLIIMTNFGVPAEHEQKLLLFGIAGALVMRAVFIAVGAAAISYFSPTFLLFGLLLMWTAVQLARHYREDPDVSDNPLIRFSMRVLPTTKDMHGGKMVATERGRRVVTPLLLAAIAIGGTDLLFALDSIPAVFGVTQDPFLVFSANAFALLGLRALFFLIEGLLGRLVYLSLGLAVILAFIGVKLILIFVHEDITVAAPTVPTWLSLVVILVVLAISTVASLIRSRTYPEERAHAGALRKRPRRETTEQPPPADPAE